MDVQIPWLVYPCFLVVAFLYGSVGLGGATGYLAVLSLFGITEPIIAPAVLFLNIAVAGISFVHFYRAGYFRWNLLLPFVITSVPASFAGGILPLTRTAFVFVLGVTLLGAGLRLILMPNVNAKENSKRSGVAYWTASMVLGTGLGLLSGVTGSGGGFLLIPVLLLVFATAPKPASTAAAGFVVVNSIAAFSGHLIRGHVNWELTLPLLGVTAVGGFVGSRLGSKYWEGETVQRVISVILIIGGIKLIAEFVQLVW